jgi:hypothetical protein
MVKCIDCAGLYLQSKDDNSRYYCISKNESIKNSEENILCVYFFSIPEFKKLLKNPRIHETSSPLPTEKH